MSRKLSDWNYKINRNLLFKALGLPQRIPADFEKRYNEFNVPLGTEVVNQSSPDDTYDRDLYLVPVSGYITDVLVRKTVDVATTTRSKSSAHRVFIKSQLDGRWIPFGRFHQYMGAKRQVIA